MTKLYTIRDRILSAEGSRVSDELLDLARKVHVTKHSRKGRKVRRRRKYKAKSLANKYRNQATPQVSKGVIPAPWDIAANKRLMRWLERDLGVCGHVNMSGVFMGDTP